MKFLTLNTHSWLEEHQPAKLLTTARAVRELDVDVVALQEANQHRDGLLLSEQDRKRFGGPSRLDLRVDHYARLLTDALTAEGVPYRWYWTENHIGYELYDEGVGFAVRADDRGPEVLEVRSILLSEHPYEDVRRRVALALKLRAEGTVFWTISGHFSWWEREGQHLFATEWEQIRAFADQVSEAIVLLGDLNNPADLPEEGYALIRSHGWADTRDLAAEVCGEETIVRPISGWEDSHGAHRIDYILTTGHTQVTKHQVVFDGTAFPVVSDHYGVFAEMTAPDPRRNDHDPASP